MILAHSLQELNLPQSWLTIGVFDGVHRGHQQIIQKLTAGAHAVGSPAVVMTFWPHPASVLTEHAVKCLTMPDERSALLDTLGVDVVVLQAFTRDLASTPAAEFVERLKRHLGFDHLLIGYDFALGKGREGNAARLTELGRALGYETDVIPALSDESGVISSTEIRKLVTIGGVAEAGTLLGHCYELHGPVVHGDGRGKQLGFPTANIRYAAEKMLPANGVYACRAWVEGTAYASAVNVGVRPQFHEKGGAPLVEAYILDFDSDIYDQDVRLEFIERLRDEQKFASVDGLIEQMHRDVERTRSMVS